jgi:HlyD family secretion protein
MPSLSRRDPDRMRFACFLFPALVAALPVAAQEEAEIDAAAIPSVTVATADLREVRAVVPVSGTVLPRNEVLVTPQVSGLQIREVYCDVGDWVSEGEVLITLRPDTLEAQLLQAEAETARSMSAISQAENEIASASANLAQVEADFDRYRSLRDSGDVSEARFEEVRARTAAARAAAATARDGLAIATAARAQADAQKKIAELNLSWTRIVAPVDGVIGSRSAKVGAMTALSGEPLLTIIDGGTVELSADVIETALATIQPGDPSEVEVAGVGPLIGLVRLVPPTVDRVTRLGEVRITLEGHRDLRSGLFGSGLIETERREAVTAMCRSSTATGWRGGR